MEPFFSELHPNPGWGDSFKSKDIDTIQFNHSENIGRHCILELYQCDHARLNDEAFIRTSITSSAKIAGATLMNLVTHSFKPQGVTGLALLAESHISIHTWPESNYSAVDIFTCGQNMMPELASQYLIESLMAKEHSLRVIERNPPSAVSNQIRTVV